MKVQTEVPVDYNKEMAEAHTLVANTGDESTVPTVLEGTELPDGTVLGYVQEGDDAYLSYVSEVLAADETETDGEPVTIH